MRFRLIVKLKLVVELRLIVKYRLIVGIYQRGQVISVQVKKKN